MDKRGIELSMNFLVVLIISIVIFGFGIKFIYQLTTQAQDLQDITIGDLDKGLGELVCEGTDRVCIGIEKKEIRRGKFERFGIKVVNINEVEDFEVTVSPSIDWPAQVLGYKKDKTPIDNTNPILFVNPATRSLTIPRNEEKVIGIGIEVPTNAVSGTYIFNVNIRQSGQDYVPVQKLYAVVP